MKSSLHVLKDTKWLILLVGSYVALVIVLLRIRHPQNLHIILFNKYLLFSFAAFSLAFLTIKLLKGDLSSYATPRNIAFSLAFILAVSPCESAFTSFKQSIVLTKGFQYDYILWKLDYLIHLENDPWTFFKPLYNHTFWIQLLDNLYMLWFLFLLLVTYWMSWTKSLKLRQTYFIATILVWSVLGSGLGYLFSSAGPCYFDMLHLVPQDPYRALFQRLQAIDRDNPLWALQNQKMLWNGYIANVWLPFGGISAMPSVHVSMATVFALTLGSRHWCLGTLGWLYFVAILIGSVVLGWHYAVDGYAAAVLTLLIWKLAGWLADKDLFARNR